MSEASGSFDLLADALKGTGAPIRRKKQPSQLFASAPIPQVIPTAPPRARNRSREIDRSRDHAHYAAPHRPVRAHAHSRPDDVATERAIRQIVVTAQVTPAKSRWGFLLLLSAFLVTTALGFGVVMLVR